MLALAIPCYYFVLLLDFPLIPQLKIPNAIITCYQQYQNVNKKSSLPLSLFIDFPCTKDKKPNARHKTVISFTCILPDEETKTANESKAKNASCSYLISKEMRKYYITKRRQFDKWFRGLCHFTTGKLSPFLRAVVNHAYS